MSTSDLATGRRDHSEAWDRGREVTAPAAALRPVRHPGDLVRVAAGGALLAAGAAVARQGRLSNLETDVFRLVNHLPATLEGPLQAVMQAGSLAAVPVAGLAALAVRKPRLGRDLVLSGTGAWVAAKALKTIVGRGRPGTLLEGVVFHGGLDTGLGFPSGHAAVAAALATAAGAYLSRTGRRLAWGVVAVVGIARIFVGAHLPVDVVGGLALGWMVGALVHLLLGAPRGGADEADVTAALASVADVPFSVSRASVDSRASTPFCADTATGERWFIKAVGHVQRDADLAFKVWRVLTRRGIEDEAPFATAKQQVEHEAYLSLLAARAGVRTPRFVSAASNDGTALLVFERVDGRSLDQLEPAALTDTVLSGVWAEVARLHAARIAHRDLRLANVLVDRNGVPWLVDFGFAEAAASKHRLAQDVAELLASSAPVVGVERAVAAARATVGPDALGAAVALLQPLALSAATRRALRQHGDTLSQLRATAANAAGIEESPLEPLARVRPRTVLLLAGALFGLHLLLPQVGELRRTLDALGAVEPGWLVLAVVCSIGTYLAAGLAVLGAVTRPLAYVRTTTVQVASSFANRVTPGSLGGAGVNIRYLQRCGLDRNEAGAAVALNTAAGVVVHVVAMVVVALLLGRHGFTFVKLPARADLLIGFTIVLVAAGVILWLPLGRRRLIPPLRQGGAAVVTVLGQPRKAAQLFGGSAAVTACYVLALCASLEAFHSPVPLVEVTAVYLGSAAIAAAAPTPGGLGAMEAALVAGLTGLGAPSGPAIAGVLAFRLVTFWLPILPGWLVFRHLLRRRVL